MKTRRFAVLSFFVLILLPGLVCGQSETNSRFRHFTEENGLINNWIFALEQDKKGYIWAGTRAGLSRMDSRSVKNFQNVPGDSLSLAGNYIYDLFCDSRGRLWVATYGTGLSLYNPENEMFTNFKHKDGDPQSLPSDRVSSVAETPDGQIWVACNGSVSTLDPETGRFRLYRDFMRTVNFSSGGSMIKLSTDREGGLWIGARHGFFRRNPDGSFYANTDFPEAEGFRHAVETADGAVWIGGMAGLVRFDPKTKTGRFFRHEPGKPGSLSNNRIWELLALKNGNLLIGGRKGLNILAAGADEFFTLHQSDYDPQSLSSDIIWSFLEDRNGGLWVGSRSGLNYYDPRSEIFQTLRQHADSPSLSGKDVNSIAEDTEGNIWIGSEFDGITIYDPKKHQFTDFEVNTSRGPMQKNLRTTSLFCESDGDMRIATTSPDLKTRFFILKKGSTKTEEVFAENPDLTQQIWTYAEDSEGRIWVGTPEGIAMSEGKNKFVPAGPFGSDLHNLKKTPVYALLFDNDSILWAASGKGLLKIRPKTGEVHFKKLLPGTGAVLGLAEGKDDLLWLAGRNGLIKFDRQTGRLRKMFNKPLRDIHTDEQGILWCSSADGIYRFDQETEEYLIYDREHGLPGKVFSQGASFKDSRGRLWFGGPQGLTFFHPDSLKPDTLFVRPVLTNLLFFNKKVPIKPRLKTSNGLSIYKLGKNISISSSIEEMEELVLGPDDIIFGFEFSSLGFRQSDKQRFRYKLEGFDKNWTETDVKFRRAIYTNVPAGNYTFSVKVINADGLPGTAIKSLKINILPPWYLTLGAKILWFFLAIVLPAGLIRFRYRELKIRASELEETVQERTTEIRSQNKELSKTLALVSRQKNEIEYWKEETISSIHYAARIQEVVLPLNEELERVFPENFILFRPRDLVSGDFYWHREENGKQLFAVADCTGHGVPGALMAILCAQALTEISEHRKLTDPGVILSETDILIRKFLKQDSTDSRDGMDAALVVWDPETNDLQFSGAKSPLMYVQNGKLEVIKGGRSSIGGEVRSKGREYPVHHLSAKEDTVLYLCSDGYRDQFGGPKAKKFKIRPFRELLLSISHLPAPAQKVILEKTLSDWIKAGQESQTDDILVWGICLR